MRTCSLQSTEYYLPSLQPYHVRGTPSSRQTNSPHPIHELGYTGLGRWWSAHTNLEPGIPHRQQCHTTTSEATRPSIAGNKVTIGGCAVVDVRNNPQDFTSSKDLGTENA